MKIRIINQYNYSVFDLLSFISNHRDAYKVCKLNKTDIIYEYSQYSGVSEYGLIKISNCLGYDKYKKIYKLLYGF